MRKLLGCTLALLALPAAASAQDPAPRWELAAGYSYLRANIAPSCGCFNAHGGTGSVAFHANNWPSWLSVVGEFGAARNGSVQSSGRDLTLFTYQAGPRFSIRRSDRATPFFHVLVGGGRASGSLYDVPLPGRTGTGPASSWLVTAGGGVDVKASRIVAIRVFRLDWVHTRFPNGGNNLQNNLRVAAGFVFRFGTR